jgi:hypothetical protein
VLRLHRTVDLDEVERGDLADLDDGEVPEGGRRRQAEELGDEGGRALVIVGGDDGVVEDWHGDVPVWVTAKSAARCRLPTTGTTDARYPTARGTSRAIRGAGPNIVSVVPRVTKPACS